jgi:hypothetical protein
MTRGTFQIWQLAAGQDGGRAGGQLQMFVLFVVALGLTNSGLSEAAPMDAPDHLVHATAFAHRASDALHRLANSLYKIPHKRFGAEIALLLPMGEDDFTVCNVAAVLFAQWGAIEPHAYNGMRIYSIAPYDDYYRHYGITALRNGLEVAVDRSVMLAQATVIKHVHQYADWVSKHLLHDIFQGWREFTAWPELRRVLFGDGECDSQPIHARSAYDKARLYIEHQGGCAMVRRGAIGDEIALRVMFWDAYRADDLDIYGTVSDIARQDEYARAVVICVSKPMLARARLWFRS